MDKIILKGGREAAFLMLKGAELLEVKNYLTISQVVGKRTPRLYLWTERGANCPIGAVLAY